MKKVLLILLFLGLLVVGWQILYAQIDSVDVVVIDETTPNGPSLTPGERYGASVANIGDLNNDGVSDVAVGAMWNDAGGTDRGAVYIHLMNLDGTIDSTAVIDDSTTNGPVLANSDNYGNSVVGLGDLNNDGVEDIAVGAPNNFGGLYIHFLNTDGSVDSTVKIDHNSLNGPDSPGIQYGIGVENIGDLNTDGVIDLMVGAHFDSENGSIRGAAFIHFMNTDGSIDSTVKINDSTPNGPMLINNSAYGQEISTIGDINNDGVVDIAVTAAADNGIELVAALFIHFMNTDGSIDSTVKIDDSTTNGPTTITETSIYGSSIEGMGDLNGDGVEDIAVGAFGEVSDTGAIYVHFMNTDGSVYRTNRITGTNQTGLTIPTNSAYGSGIANMGDYNSDGVPDIAVGAFTNDRLYIHFLDIIPDVIFTQSGGTTDVVEGGSTDTIGISLDLMVPTDDVTVTITPNSELNVDDTSFTFTSVNWDTPQFFTVTAVDDLDVEANHTGSISYTLSSDDPNYDGITVSSTTVNIADNDLGVISSIVIDYGGFAHVDEDGGLVNFVEIYLTAQPTDDVVLTLSPDAQLSLDINELTFTSVDWSSPQTVTVTAVDDTDIEGNHIGLVSYDVESLDLSYDVIVVPDVSFNIADNDVGVIVSETSGDTSVVEGGAIDSISVSLATEPTDTVTINVTSDTQTTVNPTTLTFTTGNWSTPQTVTVTAVDDVDVEGSHTSLVSFAVSSSDVNYNGAIVSDVNVDISDNDSNSGGPSSSNSHGYLTPHLRIKDNKKETASRFIDLQAIAPYTIEYYEISNSPYFETYDTFPREYTEKDLYWDICKGLSSCVVGEHTIYAKFYARNNLVIEDVVTIDYTPERECPYFKKYLRKYAKTNDPLEVKKAQEFLNREMGSGLVIDGIFGEKTDAAVRNFQDAYPEEILFPWPGLRKSTGWWYITTSAHANKLIGC